MMTPLIAQSRNERTQGRRTVWRVLGVHLKNTKSEQEACAEAVQADSALIVILGAFGIEASLAGEMQVIWQKRIDEVFPGMN